MRTQEQFLLNYVVRSLSFSRRLELRQPVEEFTLDQRLNRLMAVEMCRRYNRFANFPSYDALEEMHRNAELFADCLISIPEAYGICHTATLPSQTSYASRCRDVQVRLDVTTRSLFTQTFKIHALNYVLYSLGQNIRFNSWERTDWPHLVQLDKDVHEILATVIVRTLRPERPFDPNWKTSIVTSLANTIYVNKDWSRLPVLADALTEVGFDQDDLLHELRTERRWFRGEWLLDRCCGKRTEGDNA